MIPPPEVRELTIKDYWDIIWRRSWVVITLLVVIPTVVGIKSFSTPKVYQTQTKLILKGDLTSGIASERRSSSRVDIVLFREEQANFLLSRDMAERVIKKLNLTSDEEFIGVTNPVAKLRRMASASFPKEANMLFLVITGHHPIKITKIANAWAEEFVLMDIENRTSATKRGMKWLKDQLEETLKKLEDAEKKLNEFLKNNQIITIPDIGERKEALLEQIKTQRANLEKEIIEMQKKYGEKHPKMEVLYTQLEAINQKLKEEQAQIYSLQEKSLEYKILRREVDTYRTIYNDLLKRLKDLEISQRMTIPQVQILDKAEVPSSPIKPTPEKDIFKAIVISLFLGIGLCYFLEYADSTLKTSEDVEFYTKLPFLGYIPSVYREIRRKEKKELIAYLKPYAHASEAFRNLRVSLIFSFPEDKPLKTILVTSSLPNEGKSFIASNLAITFAQAKEETLLIDADMRKGRLAEIFDLNPRDGLSNLLAGMCKLEEAIIVSPVPGLSFIGRGPSTPNPAELLSSQKIIDILEGLKKRFKRIVIDAPPTIGVSDTVLLGDKVDGLVFVIKSNSTSLNTINEARKLLGKKIKIIGAVLNNLHFEADRYYSYYHYYHYSSQT